MTLKEAALGLKTWINEYALIYRPHGMVGVGTDKIIVFMYCRKKQWRSPLPQIYEGWPVEWQWNVGRPKPLTA
jgi:hypothetical protein